MLGKGQSVQTPQAARLCEIQDGPAFVPLRYNAASPIRAGRIRVVSIGALSKSYLTASERLMSEFR
jgi:hypothetical protein